MKTISFLPLSQPQLLQTPLSYTSCTGGVGSRDCSQFITSLLLLCIHFSHALSWDLYQHNASGITTSSGMGSSMGCGVDICSPMKVHFLLILFSLWFYLFFFPLFLCFCAILALLKYVFSQVPHLSWGVLLCLAVSGLELAKCPAHNKP